MSFHQTLTAATRDEQEALLRIPFVAGALRGDLDRASYVAFLTQAYHHVRHTVPLLHAMRAALGVRHAWLAAELLHYVAEEEGHDQWILDDIAASGGDAAQARDAGPDLPCELMVAYAYDMIERVHPLGFLGMVHVLEGTSVRAATAAAAALQRGLDLPPHAFTYLTTHGSLDVDHVVFFQGLMDRIEHAGDQRAIVHAAHAFFRLYGDVLRALPTHAPGAAAPVEARR